MQSIFCNVIILIRHTDKQRVSIHTQREKCLYAWALTTVGAFRFKHDAHNVSFILVLNRMLNKNPRYIICMLMYASCMRRNASRVTRLILFSGLCVRAYVLARVHACVRVHVYVRACMCACVKYFYL